MQGALLTEAYLAGTREAAIALTGTNLSASTNNGGALRFAVIGASVPRIRSWSQDGRVHYELVRPAAPTQPESPVVAQQPE